MDYNKDDPFRNDKCYIISIINYIIYMFSGGWNGFPWRENNILLQVVYLLYYI